MFISVDGAVSFQPLLSNEHRALRLECTGTCENMTLRLCLGGVQQSFRFPVAVGTHTPKHTHSHTDKLANLFKVTMDRITEQITGMAYWPTKTLPCCQRRSKGSYLIMSNKVFILFLTCHTHTLCKVMLELSESFLAHTVGQFV